MPQAHLVMALYRANPGKDVELLHLIKEHFPTLQKYGLTTDHPPFVAQSSSGTYLEIFEWKNADAAKSAHDHPAIAKIWEAMGMICTFEKLSNLPEIASPFARFAKVEL